MKSSFGPQGESYVFWDLTCCNIACGGLENIQVTQKQQPEGTENHMGGGEDKRTSVMDRQTDRYTWHT